MKSFKEFVLNEAAVFNINKFGRVLELFEKTIERRIGKPIYRFGGEDGIVNIKYSGGTGIGILYLYGESSAFRINWVKMGNSFGFESIDIWLKFGLKNFAEGNQIKPSFRIKLPEDVNIISVVNAVAEVLKNPKPGAKVFITESKDVELYENLLTEKRKVEFQEFLQYAMKEFPSGYTALKAPDIKTISDKYDITIPGVVWGLKGGRGLFDLSKQPENDQTTNSTMKNAQTDMLLISRGDDGKFYKMDFKTGPAEELKKAQIQIDRVLKTQETKELTPAHILFEDMEELVTIVGTGQRPSLMVIGGPGIGKTHTVIQTLKGLGLEDREDYVVVKGRTTPSALYRTLFMNHDRLIVFDDCDSVFGDMDAVNVLKDALDSYDVRIISWLSAQTINVSRMSKSEHDEFIEETRERLIEDPTDLKLKLPSEFEFTGRIIFISNLPKNKLDGAIISRSLTIDMTLTQEQVLDRMEGVMSHLGDPNQSIEEKVEVLNYLREQTKSGGVSDFGEINMRTFIAALGIKASGSPQWKRLLRYV